MSVYAIFVALSFQSATSSLSSLMVMPLPLLLAAFHVCSAGSIHPHFLLLSSDVALLLAGVASTTCLPVCSCCCCCSCCCYFRFVAAFHEWIDDRQ